jgi:hypothetical protein
MKAMKKAAYLSLLLILSYSTFIFAEGNFKIAEPAITGGSERSTSSSFVMQACISNNPGGTSSSDSFTTQTGCGTVFFQKETEAQNTNQGEAGKIDSAPAGNANQTPSDSSNP